MKISKQQLALLAYVAVCVIWGSTYLAIRIGVTAMPPMLFAGIRFVIAGLLMLGISYFMKRTFPKTPKDYMRQAVVGIFLLLGGNGLVVLAEQYVPSNIAALMIAVVPLFMALIELFLPKSQKMDWKGWLGLCIGFAGVVLLMSWKGAASEKLYLPGLLLLVLASFFWACGSIYSKSFKLSGDMMPSLGFQMLAGGASQILTGLVMGEASRFTFPPAAMWSMLYLIFFGSLLGYTSYLYLLQVWPAAKAGTYAYVNPVVAMFLGFIILKEPLTIAMGISAVVILVGVFLVQISKVKKTAVEAKK